ncbi:coth-domain-containing protein [Neocallimastix sp. 'constans']
MKVNSLSLALSTLIVLTKAEKWKFNVVSIKTSEYSLGLKYDNKIIRMSSEVYPLFTTTIESGLSSSYKYVVLDKDEKVVEEEDILRTYTPETSSINEVFNRHNKKVDVPSFPKVYDKPLFNGGTDKYQPYDDNQIYTVYAKCNENEYNYLKYNSFVNVNGSNLINQETANCTVTFITPNDVYQRNGALELIGFDSRRYKKLSWKIKMDKKILGRKSLKLRANSNDASLMRDKLTSELYKSLDVPTYSSAYARLIINDDVYGLYSIVDSIGGNWIASAIHGNDKARVGYTYKTFAGANLEYHGDSPSEYNPGVYKIAEIDKDDINANGNDYYRLIQFTKSYKEWDDQYGNDQSNAAVEALEKFFNLDSLLRQMVVEALVFAFDDFWANSGNFALYYNPEQDKYQIIPYDFDGSFYGNKGSPRFNSNYLTEPMDCFNWAEKARNNEDTYFISRLFKHDLIKKKYDKIMHDTLTKVFNVPVMSTMIDSLEQLIEEDVEWSSGLIDILDPNITGYINHYTLSDFKGNINYSKVPYNPKVNQNQSQFGLKQWIKSRSEECVTYVSLVGVPEEEEASSKNFILFIIKL